MPSVSQTINDLSYVLGVPRTRVNSIARALIDACILPKSSGRTIKQLNEVQLGALVAAAAMSDKVEQAAETATAIMGLRLNGDPRGEQFKSTFAANINSDERQAMPRLTFSRMESGYSAELEGTFILSGELVTGKALYWKTRTWASWTKTSFTLAPEGFEIMRNLFRTTYDEDARPIYCTAMEA